MSEGEQVVLRIYLRDPRGNPAEVRLETADSPTMLELLDTTLTTLKLNGFNFVEWEVLRYGGEKNE